MSCRKKSGKQKKAGTREKGKGGKVVYVDEQKGQQKQGRCLGGKGGLECLQEGWCECIVNTMSLVQAEALPQQQLQQQQQQTPVYAMQVALLHTQNAVLMQFYGTVHYLLCIAVLIKPSCNVDMQQLPPPPHTHQQPQTTLMQQLRPRSSQQQAHHRTCAQFITDTHTGWPY
jgi:hypothetical protein